MDLTQLRQASLEDLEAVYAGTDDFPLATPRGQFAGEVLARLDSPGAHRLGNRLMMRLGFEWPRFGIDFDRCVWFFVSRRLRGGRFEAVAGPSRWREARVLQLHYDRSRLPRRLRERLYDEIKPLTPELCLGLGGVNAGPGEGDLFFFALSRR